MATHVHTPSLNIEPSALAQAVMQAGMEEPPLPVPQGSLGGCLACGRPASTHMQAGHFIGCTKAQVDTVFILVPIHRHGSALQLAPAPTAEPQLPDSSSSSGTGPQPSSSSDEPAIEPTWTRSDVTAAPAPSSGSHRGFARARYKSAVHHKAKVEKLDLAPKQKRVLKVLHANYRTGLVARDIMRKARLPHGSVQSTLNWLRAHNYVAAVEDAAVTAPAES